MVGRRGPADALLSASDESAARRASGAKADSPRTPPTASCSVRVRNISYTALSLLAVGSGCALSPRPVATVLAPALASPSESEAFAIANDESLPLPQRAARLQGLLDRLTATALERARAQPDDAKLALAATSRLFEAADLRLRRASLSVLDATPKASLAKVLAVEDSVPDKARDEILALCSKGLEIAERAARTQPNDVGLQLHIALHLSLVAWANGPARSFFAGYGPRLVRAMDRAIELDAKWDHAAPLRLRGRFRGMAPWPYGDLDVARESLSRAVEIAPLAINCLFFGDVLWASGEHQKAAAQWRSALTAPDDDSTRYVTPLLHELARRRLAVLPPSHHAAPK